MAGIRVVRVAARSAVIAFGAFLLLVAMSLPASAATIQVTTTADENNTNPSACSLREAVTAANTDAAFGGCSAGNGSDQITFASSTNGNTILVETTAIAITSDMAMVGNGSAQTVIDGQKGTGFATQILTISAGQTVSVDALTLQNGSTGALGAGINNAGTLTVTNAVFTGNRAANGGGIATIAGSTLTVSDTSFDGNTATSVGGGGIIAFGPMTVRNSLFVSNTAAINGGGINVQPGGTVNLISSTMSSNISGGLGGGVSNLGTMNFVHVTLTGNNSTGGDAMASGNSNVSFRATILANSSNGDNCNPIGGPFTDLGSNIADDTSCFPDGGTNQVVADVKISTLQNNTGPTKTHALLSGSPAIDAVQGPCTEDGTGGGAAITTDQRGATRPGGGRCDIGAFELNLGTFQFSSPTFTGSESAGTAAITVTRTDGPDGPASVTVTPSNGTATAPADFSATPITVNFANLDFGNKTVNVSLVDDGVTEQNETVNLTLSNPTGGAALGSQKTAVLTISDNELPALSISSPEQPEGNVGTSTLNFNVTLSAPVSQTVTVQFATSDGTAKAGEDYTAANGTLTFAAGETSKTISVQINGDTKAEPDETFLVTIGNASNASVGIGTGTGTIKDDDNVYVTPGDDSGRGTGKNKDNDSQKPPSQIQQQQTQHTNNSNLEQYHTEGNVASVERSEDGKTMLITIALGRGETLVVEFKCSPEGCPDVRPGDYLSADGEQGGREEQGHFIAEQIDITRGGGRVR